MKLSFRQRILKKLYPLLMKVGKWSGKLVHANPGKAAPPVSFYKLEQILNDGRMVDFSSFRGKKVLLVNTASDCGYTSQYQELEQLSRSFPESLVVIGFPANDFGKQEKGSDHEIARFCQVHFGINFPLARKSSVVKGEGQNLVFFWLSHSECNGWNEQQPSWNFTKYLVNEEGMLTHVFHTALSPLSEEVVGALKETQVSQ